MKRWPRLLIGAIAVAAIAFSALAGARAETINLELKRLEPLSPVTMAGGKMPADYLFRVTSPQYFSMRAGSTDTSWILQGSSRPAVKPFPEVVSKEPDKYRSELPFRGVARLGSDDYGFVLDLVPPEPDPKEPGAESEAGQPGDEEAQADSAEAVPESQESAADFEESKPKAYCALYFDRNHNGDLTDDEALEAEPPADQISGGYWWYQFPRIDVTLNLDGAQVDYGFLFGVSARVRGSVRYATAALMAGAYREGKITRAQYQDIRVNDRRCHRILPQCQSGHRLPMRPIPSARTICWPVLFVTLVHAKPATCPAILHVAVGTGDEKPRSISPQATPVPRK